ncbi:hypothetical protein [Streptosporangium sp. NPDC051022]|uniref:hypothetical protein n=1 Tax=Streptosporangium sp. NPDC051022 TaxID=3155752 RepID=UPI003413C214
MIGLRSARPPGRHRAGQPHISVHRRLWDGPARAHAEQLERSWPAWLILYSLGNRRFYAIAAWPAPEPTIVCDDTAEGLEEQMRQTETDLIQRPLSTPSPASPSPISRGAVSPVHATSPPQQAAMPRFSRRAA